MFSIFRYHYLKLNTICTYTIGKGLKMIINYSYSIFLLKDYFDFVSKYYVPMIGFIIALFIILIYWSNRNGY